MNLFPLYNSIRIALISTFITFFIALLIVNFIIKLPTIIRGFVDVILTLPLVLPPTVIGYLIIKFIGPKRLIGKIFIEYFNIKLIMNWWSAIFATFIIILPLMYRAIRSSFEVYDEHYSEISMDLGATPFQTFWKIKIPICKEGIITGIILSFARALGEYGATSMLCGYIPNKTSTIATTVYQLWRTNNDKEAFFWVIVNIFISLIVLLFMNMYEKKIKKL